MSGSNKPLARALATGSAVIAVAVAAIAGPNAEAHAQSCVAATTPFVFTDDSAVVGNDLNVTPSNHSLGIVRIDFNNDLRRGDRFELLFEKLYRADLFGGHGEMSFSGYGDVLAVDFVNDGRRVRAFRFHVPGEPEAHYFDENGRSMKRLFLRSPFRFEPRVTSRFSYRRVHPVHGGVRPHLGVDYGAPTGTPVIAVATGTVVSVGRSGGSGNMVRLRHTSGYETYYLHLSGFAQGLGACAAGAQRNLALRGPAAHEDGDMLAHAPASEFGSA